MRDSKPEGSPPGDPRGEHSEEASRAREQGDETPRGEESTEHRARVTPEEEETRGGVRRGPRVRGRVVLRPRSAAELVPLAFVFYGVLAALAVIWRVVLMGEPILYASQAAAARGVRPVPDIAAGLLAAGIVILLSHEFTRRTHAGEGLARSLAQAIGPVTIPQGLVLAALSGVAEEAFFRGALQPRVGLVAASLIFGLVHFVPRRELLPWSAFSVGAGLLLGLLFEATGNLVAPTVAHVTVNAVNLPLLSRRYGRGGPGGGDRGRGDGGEDDVRGQDASQRDDFPPDGPRG